MLSSLSLFNGLCSHPQPVKKSIKTNQGWGLWTDEIDYIKSLLKSDFTVLEWGSGSSTELFAPLVKKYISIEHDATWFSHMKKILPKSTSLILVPPSQPWGQHIPKAGGPGNDGTYTQFQDYVDIVEYLGEQFDLVLIDGRARVECAKAVLPYVKKNGLVLIHDFERKHYHKVFDWYNLQKQVHVLAILEPKQLSKSRKKVSQAKKAKAKKASSSKK